MTKNQFLERVIFVSFSLDLTPLLYLQRDKNAQFPIWGEGASNRRTSDKTSGSKACNTSLFIALRTIVIYTIVIYRRAHINCTLERTLTLFY